MADVDTKLITTDADEQLKYPRLRDEQTIAAEIIDEIDSTRDDVAERLEASLIVSETCRTMNGGIDDMNIRAEPIEPIAKKVDEIATKLDGQTVTKMREKVDRIEHCEVDTDEKERVEAIAKTKKLEESSTMGKFDSFQELLETFADGFRQSQEKLLEYAESGGVHCFSNTQQAGNLQAMSTLRWKLGAYASTRKESS